MESMKETLMVVVEMASDDTFACYVEDEEKDFGAVGYGNTSNEAKRDFMEAYRELREEYAKSGRDVPDYAFTFRDLCK